MRFFRYIGCLLVCVAKVPPRKRSPAVSHERQNTERLAGNLHAPWDCPKQCQTRGYHYNNYSSVVEGTGIRSDIIAPQNQLCALQIVQNLQQ